VPEVIAPEVVVAEVAVPSPGGFHSSVQACRWAKLPATRCVQSRPCAGPSGASGFTVIELLIVVGIIAVMFAIAAPSLRTMFLRNQMRTVTSDLLSDIAVARSEASKLSQRVVICASNDQITCTAATNWTAGWIAFVDANNNGQRNPAGSTEPLIRIRDASPSAVSITSGGVTALSFRAIGVVNTASTFVICPAAAGTGVTGRNISMNALGRVQTTNSACP
jgi:type IV fimbrial biogenesis protein FimT